MSPRCRPRNSPGFRQSGSAGSASATTTISRSRQRKQPRSRHQGFRSGCRAAIPSFISNSAADIETLTAAQIAGLPALYVTQINANDTSVSLTVAQAKALEVRRIPVSAPAGDTVQVSDTAAHLQGLTASQIGGLAAIGVTGLVSTTASVSYSPTQSAAILSSGLTVSAPASDTVTENFANGDYSVYQGGQLIQQQSVNPDGSYDVAYFGVTGKAYSSYEDIYNSAGTLVADAQNNVNGTGNLLLYANGLTVTSSSGSDSVTTGSDTFAITPQSVETTTADQHAKRDLRLWPRVRTGHADRFPGNGLQPRSPAIQRFDIRLPVHTIADRRCSGPAQQLCVGNDQHRHHGPSERYADHQQSRNLHLPKQPRRLQVYLTALPRRHLASTRERRRGHR